MLVRQDDSHDRDPIDQREPSQECDRFREGRRRFFVHRLLQGGASQNEQGRNRRRNRRGVLHKAGHRLEPEAPPIEDRVLCGLDEAIALDFSSSGVTVATCLRAEGGLRAEILNAAACAVGALAGRAVADGI